MPPWAPPGAPAPAMPGPSRLQAGQVGQHPLGLRLLVVAFEAERPDGPIQLRLGLPSLLDGVLPDRELEEVELADGPTLHDHVRDLPDPDLLPSRRSDRWEQGERVQGARHPRAGSGGSRGSPSRVIGIPAQSDRNRNWAPLNSRPTGSFPSRTAAIRRDGRSATHEAANVRRVPAQSSSTRSFQPSPFSAPCQLSASCDRRQGRSFTVASSSPSWTSRTRRTTPWRNSGSSTPAVMS